MAAYDVIVIGGGAVGAASLFHLSLQAKGKTLLLEKRKGFARGATGTGGALVRMFHLHPTSTESAAKSVPFYVDFEKHTGKRFTWNKTGALYFLKQNEISNFSGHLDTLRSSGLDFRLIEAAEGRVRFPEFSWYEDDICVFEPNAGVACPWGTIDAFMDAAQSRGAMARVDAEVVDIVCKSGRVEGVKTADGEFYACGQLVVASGIWTNNLLKKIDTNAPVYPKAIQLNRFCRHHQKVSLPFFVDKNARVFGHPSDKGSFVGGYLPVVPKNGSERLEHVSLQEANHAKQKIARRVPWVKNATLEGGVKALESYTDSTVGIVERSQDYSNLVVSAGWSCCGFTLAPYIGKRVAETTLA